jgi:dihydroorotase
MNPLFITGGRVVDPAASLDSLRDVRVRDGRIAEIGERLECAQDEELVDAGGMIVAPGFIDMHVHLREPGYPQKETIATGTEAAVRGGFTTVACMPNTDPALDEPAILAELMKRIEREARCRVVPIAAITRRREGREPCDFSALAAAGAVAFSDDGDTVADGAVLRKAALQARALRPPFIEHCEPEGPIVARDLELARHTDKQWHVAHVSTAGALERIRAARERGVSVTCEVTPHHLTFTRELRAEMGAKAKVNPPLRARADVEALRRAVQDGTIDAFASDHAPHTEAEKAGDYDRAAPGFSGLEVAVGAYAAALPEISWLRFVELIAANPARILGLPGGTLAPGAAADITIVAERPWRVDSAKFASKGRCTPFAGRVLPRKVMGTIVGGALRYRAQEWVA